MPTETKLAITWALQQNYADSLGDTHQVTKNDYQILVDKVREYFNMNSITYLTFSYDDLIPYL